MSSRITRRRSKCETILAHRRADGLEAQLERVYAPIGLKLGGPTPGEIALAIMAEVVAVRRGGSGAMLSRPPGET